MTTPDDPNARPQWSPPPEQPGPAPPYDQPYGQAGHGAPPKSGSGVQILSIIGFVFAAIALLFIPILFGLIGIVLGIVGHTRGESLGKWAAVASGVTMILGMLIGFLVVRSMTG